ncbi:MAG: nicotinate phosphoribosyltransferase [Candidatus Thermoplasmatota archaeon]
MVQGNFILRTDAYKQTHWLQYPENTRHVYSYLESRGGEWDRTVFFGLQILLKKYFEGQVVTDAMIDEADAFCRQVFGHDYFNRAGWEYIVDAYDGRLPLCIKAVPEGTVVPTKNVLMTVVNTDAAVPFLTNFVETLLMQVWYPTTVCTLSWQIKQLIRSYAVKAGQDVSPFHLNDFGFRGVSSVESAGIGGAAHLVNFLGTDTLEGIKYAMDYYDAQVCGFSVMAAEHSTVTAYGKENEAFAYRTFINRCPDGATVSIVSDSWDIMRAVNEIYGDELRDYILSRDIKCVVRPDSGDPIDVSAHVLEALWDRFGGTENEMGYRVLNPKVGVIYGDGITYQSINKILHEVVDHLKFAPSNLIFGMGGGLQQQVNRDTQKFAFKCSAIDIAGPGECCWRDVYKEPVTDPGKRSKRGQLKLVKMDSGYVTRRVDEPGDDALQIVFHDGDIVNPTTFDAVRARSGE